MSAITGDILDVPDDILDGSLRDSDGDKQAERAASEDYRWIREWRDCIAE